MMMGVDFQHLLNTRFATQIGLGLVGKMPVRVGYVLAKFAADRLAARPSQPIVKALHGNLSVVYGDELSSTELDEVVRRALRSRTRALFDFYHALGNDSKMKALVNYGDRFPEFLRRNASKDHGTIAAVIHMGNPELLAIAGPLAGMRGFGVTAPEESGGYELLNEIRDRAGLETMPASMAAVKKATRVLKEKGTVFVGLDRPVPGSGYHPRFFGRPTALPVLHVSLALKADVPIIVFGAKRRADGIYDVLVSDFIYMEKHSNRKTELITNAERLLAVAEGFIRQAPEQWGMVHPLWSNGSG